MERLVGGAPAQADDGQDGADGLHQPEVLLGAGDGEKAGHVHQRPYAGDEEIEALHPQEDTHHPGNVVCLTHGGTLHMGHGKYSRSTIALIVNGSA